MCETADDCPPPSRLTTTNKKKRDLCITRCTRCIRFDIHFGDPVHDLIKMHEKRALDESIALLCGYYGVLQLINEFANWESIFDDLNYFREITVADMRRLKQAIC